MTTHLMPAINASASPPWPLAIGVLLLTRGTPGDAPGERRLNLALGAYRLGYFLLDLVEVDADLAGRGPCTSPGCAWAGVEALAARAGADALVVQTSAAALPLGTLPTSLAALPLRLLRD